MDGLAILTVILLLFLIEFDSIEKNRLFQICNEELILLIDSTINFLNAVIDINKTIYSSRGDSRVSRNIRDGVTVLCHKTLQKRIILKNRFSFLSMTEIFRIEFIPSI